MSVIPFRTLIAEDRPDLGQQDGPHRFKLHTEFVMQLEMMVSNNLGWKLTHNVSLGQAKAIARMIQQPGHERFWGIHMATWGDPRQIVLRQFVEFLRAGGFSIVQPGR